MNTANQHLGIAGHFVTIRPLRHSDEELENEFLRRRLPEARHYCFLGAVKQFTPGKLKDCYNVDGHRSMAFVATVVEDGREVEIGVSRYASNADSDVREITITIANDWQYQGLGARLANQLIRYARERGVRNLYSIDLADNAPMRHLAEDLGMTIMPDPDDRHQLIYSLSLAEDPATAGVKR